MPHCKNYAFKGNLKIIGILFIITDLLIIYQIPSSLASREGYFDDDNRFLGSKEYFSTPEMTLNFLETGEYSFNCEVNDSSITFDLFIVNSEGYSQFLEEKFYIKMNQVLQIGCKLSNQCLLFQMLKQENH